MVSAGSSTAQPVSADTLELARKHVAAYAAPQDGRAAWVVGVTVLLWVGSLLLGSCWFRGTQPTTWQGLALSVCWVFLRAGSLVRVFVMMHDATHNALFSRRWLNSLSAATTGLMTGMDAGGKHWVGTHNKTTAAIGVEQIRQTACMMQLGVYPCTCMILGGPGTTTTKMAWHGQLVLACSLCVPRDFV
jgi:hypothetical protein